MTGISRKQRKKRVWQIERARLGEVASKRGSDQCERERARAFVYVCVFGREGERVITWKEWERDKRGLHVHVCMCVRVQVYVCVCVCMLKRKLPTFFATYVLDGGGGRVVLQKSVARPQRYSQCDDRRWAFAHVHISPLWKILHSKSGREQARSKDLPHVCWPVQIWKTNEGSATSYGVAMTGRHLKSIGLCCRMSSLL